LTGQLSFRPTGTVRTLGVRFRPGSAAAILRVPQQPHFIREFTELAGCSPGAHLLGHAELSGCFTNARGPNLDNV
jgi:hypothetical protein